ncbi:MAG: ABC transporter permease subunit [Acidimicrobiia bacterium]|nr:ABC transporter permease subunit [Acidimicrobiia bacterium]
MWERTIEHLTLTGIAVAFGFLLSVGLSLVALRWRVTYKPITWLSGVLYTIPSLGLFAFLVPFTGPSLLTAQIGLVIYTLLILVRNIVTGIDGVPADVVEAARGMGYERRELLWQIEVPLALPVIIAGVRIATVTTIGLVTITSLIGQGGYGVFIERGISRRFLTEILVGTVLSVLLAVLLDYLLVRVGERVAPWSRKVAV